MISVGLVADHTHEAPSDHTGICLSCLPTPHARTGRPRLTEPFLCTTGGLEKYLEALRVVDPRLALLLPGAQLESLKPGHECLPWRQGWKKQRGRTVGSQAVWPLEAVMSPLEASGSHL